MEDEESGFTYRHDNGENYVAADVETARRLCTKLGELSIEQASLLLKLQARGIAQTAQEDEPVGNKAILKVVPKATETTPVTPKRIIPIGVAEKKDKPPTINGPLVTYTEKSSTSESKESVLPIVPKLVFEAQHNETEVIATINLKTIKSVDAIPNFTEKKLIDRLDIGIWTPSTRQILERTVEVEMQSPTVHGNEVLANQLILGPQEQVTNTTFIEPNSAVEYSDITDSGVFSEGTITEDSESYLELFSPNEQEIGLTFSLIPGDEEDKVLSSDGSISVERTSYNDDEKLAETVQLNIYSPVDDVAPKLVAQKNEMSGTDVPEIIPNTVEELLSRIKTIEPEAAVVAHVLLDIAIQSIENQRLPDTTANPENKSEAEELTVESLISLFRHIGLDYSKDETRDLVRLIFADEKDNHRQATTDEVINYTLRNDDMHEKLRQFLETLRHLKPMTSSLHTALGKFALLSSTSSIFKSAEQRLVA